MYIFKTVSGISRFLKKKRVQNVQVGFVPTMGALHSGHLSLIAKSNQENGITVCSIFVNPTQFNEASDLEKYPRTIEADLEKLLAANTDVVFLPSVEEVYPSDISTAVDIDLGSLTKYMEGEHRPGHFDGVVQVVKRLLDIVMPHHIYMGQKDFQQWSIIRRMVELLELPTKVVRCPIVREESGLAMSSRNRRLSDEAKEIAPLIYQTLLATKRAITTEHDLIQLKDEAIRKLSIPEFEIDYFEIADGKTLLPISKADEAQLIVACTAVFLDGVRLIDNMVIKDD